MLQSLVWGADTGLVSLTVSPPVRIVAILGLVAALALGAGFMLMGHSSDAVPSHVAIRHQQREVEQARVPVGRLRARLLPEPEELRRVGTQRGAARALLQHVEPDDLPVVVERPLEVGHREVHRAHPRLGGKRHVPAR